MKGRDGTCLFCGFAFSDHPIVVRGSISGRVYTCDPDDTPESRATVQRKKSELVPLLAERAAP